MNPHYRHSDSFQILSPWAFLRSALISPEYAHVTKYIGAVSQ